MILYLTGFMGCGKTTIGQRLKEAYGFRLLEMDGEIAEKAGKTIPEIFAQDGEECFRNMETDLLKNLNTEERLVVSCGGGTVMRECNVQEMKRNGKIILLSAKPETVYDRVRTSHDRPLLENNMNPEYIRELMEKRREAYEKAADVVIVTDGKSVEAICREIMEAFV